jgi:trk system potassium uptake protein TrkA
MKRVLIVGLGVFGELLAKNLFRNNVEVIAIDQNSQFVEKIKNHVTLAVQLDSTDEAALRSIIPDELDLAIVTIGENFEANLMTSVLLKELGVQKVISRASQDLQKKILLKSGVDLIITPEEIVAHILSQDVVNDTEIVESYVNKLLIKEK